MKIKITEKGWAGYTGLLGATHFVDGISVEDVTETEANRLGSIVRMEEVNDAGEGQGQVSLTKEMERTQKLGSPVVTPHPRMTETVPPAPTIPVIEAPAPLASEVVVPARAFTQAELEAIADEKGIKGLREISAPLGLKASAIPALIGQILDHQKKNPPAAA